jgi:gliding motility-associated-like protein
MIIITSKLRGSFSALLTIPLIIAFLLSPKVYGQWQNGLWIGKQANNWCLNANFGIEFGSGYPSSFQGVAMNALEGTATISDTNGQLLFYAGDTQIWNKNDQPLLNGDNIIGSSSSTQHGVFIQKPGNPNIYYFFTVNKFDNTTGLLYSEIDITLDGGLGGVTSNKNIVVDPDIAGEKITAVYHYDKQQVWIVNHRKMGSDFVAFLVTEAGINAPVVSTGGISYPDPSISSSSAINGPCSQLKVSPDGTKLAAAITRGINRGVDLFNFDNQTGAITFTSHLTGFTGDLYGLEFSPNSRFLYTSDPISWSFGGSVCQYDLSLDTPELIASSKVELVNLQFSYYDANYAMQLAPDGRIYLRNANGQSLNVINYPNNPGIACGFELDDVLTGSVTLGLPTLNQSYFQSGIVAEPLCFGKALFSLLRIPDASLVTWDFGDPQSGPENTSESPLHTFSAAGTYLITATVTSNGTTQIAQMQLSVEDPGNGIVSPEALRLCQGNSNTSLFDLTTQTGILLATVNPDDYAVSYYTDYIDATIGNNPIAQPQSFASEGQPIFVQIQDLTNGCILIKEFDLIIDTLPLIQTVGDISACGDGQRAIAFDLTQQEPVLLENQNDVTIMYYTSQNNATAGSNPITTPDNFTITSGPKTIYVALTNDLGCTSYTSFNLVVLQEPKTSQLTVMMNCGDNDKASFDLQSHALPLLTGQQNITIDYYTSEQDAYQYTDPITEIQHYENQTNPQTIYVRLTSATCFAITSFDILVDNGPTLPGDLEFIACPPFDLTTTITDSQAMLIGYYHNEQDAINNSNVILNPESYIFAQNTIVYFTVSNTSGCIRTGSLSLKMGDCEIPRGISPNDDDKNDTFDLTLFNVSKISIFNRYGLLVYHQTHYTDQWHGQDNSGGELSVGTYYYTIEMEGGNLKTGWVYINK